MAVSPPAPTIRLLLVEDHVVVRQAVRLLLESQSGFTVVGEASTGAQALEVAARERPSMVVLDLILGREHGVDLIPAVIRQCPGVRVLVLTAVGDVEQHRAAVRAGASGVVLKDHASEVLVKAIRRVHEGELWMDRGTTARLVDELRKAPGPVATSPDTQRIAALTAREREIVALVALGHGTLKIADLLSISEKTVRNHLASIYAKLGVSERLELALYAVKHGLAPKQPGGDASTD